MIHQKLFFLKKRQGTRGERLQRPQINPPLFVSVRFSSLSVLHIFSLIFIEYRFCATFSICRRRIRRIPKWKMTERLFRAFSSRFSKRLRNVD